MTLSEIRFNRETLTAMVPGTPGSTVPIEGDGDGCCVGGAPSVSVVDKGAIVVDRAVASPSPNADVHSGIRTGHHDDSANYDPETCEGHWCAERAGSSAPICSPQRLKAEGYWVRGVDLKEPEFTGTAADDFLLLDLRERTSGSRLRRCAVTASTRCTNWRPTWAGWVSSGRPRRTC